MKKVLLFFICVTISIVLKAQVVMPEVISVSGDSYSNNEYVLDFTVGEVAIESLQNEQTIVTQGFHQTKLIVAAVSKAENSNFKLTVFPNPSTNRVFVQSTNRRFSPTNYELLDINGKLLTKDDILTDYFEVDVSQYQQGTYLLKVCANKRNACMIYKIQKQ